MKKSISKMVTAALAVSFRTQQEGAIAYFSPAAADVDNVVVSKQLLEVLMKRSFYGYKVGEFETPEYRVRRLSAQLEGCREHEEITDVLQEELVLQPIKEFIISANGQE